MAEALESDTLSLQLFQIMCKKVGVASYCGVRIPDTIIFEYNCPRTWFYYDRVVKEIRKRPGQDMQASSIFAEFGKPVHFRSKELDVVATYTYSFEDALTDESATSVEYFTRQTLEQFLLLPNEIKRLGILQRFVPSKESPHTVLQASWSPRVCIVKRRSGLKHLTELQIPILERFVTFDGPEHYSTEGVSASKTITKVRSCCESLIDHIYNSERLRVTGIVLYFKVDQKNTLNLLWCGHLRASGADRAKAATTAVQLNPVFRCPAAERVTSQSMSVAQLEALDDQMSMLIRDRSELGQTDEAMLSPHRHRSASPSSRGDGFMGSTYSGWNKLNDGLGTAKEQTDSKLQRQLAELSLNWFSVNDDISQDYNSLKGQCGKARALVEDTLYVALSHFQQHKPEDHQFVLPSELSRLLGGPEILEDFMDALSFTAGDGGVCYLPSPAKGATSVLESASAMGSVSATDGQSGKKLHPIPTLMKEADEWLLQHFQVKIDALKDRAAPLVEIAAVRMCRESMATAGRMSVSAAAGAGGMAVGDVTPGAEMSPMATPITTPLAPPP